MTLRWNPGKYSKLIAGLVGLVAVILGPDFMDLTEDSEALAQQILGVLALMGIYFAPKNKE